MRTEVIVQNHGSASACGWTLVILFLRPLVEAHFPYMPVIVVFSDGTSTAIGPCELKNIVKSLFQL